MDSRCHGRRSALLLVCLAALVSVTPRAASAKDCTGADILELIGGCNVLVGNDDFVMRLYAPTGADITSPDDLRESLNRAVLYLHGYGVVDTSPPQFLREDGSRGSFWDLNEEGLAIVTMTAGNSKADRVQDDAAAARRGLEWLNAWRGDDALPWIVIGHSMGGLMARIALAELEADGVDHDVALYVSYDSPHSGVHVPQGMQYLKLKLDEWTAMTEEDFIAIDPGWKGVFKLGSIDGMRDTLGPTSGGYPDPTSLQAQQMTIQGLAFPEEYPAFMSLLDDVGFPQVRSLGISNGNTRAVGTTQEIPAGGELFYFTGAKGNSAASVRGTFEVFTDDPGEYCFKSHVYYDGLLRNHDGGRKDAWTAEDIVAMDHLSGGTLDYAEEMKAAADRARRDFHNPSYRGAENSPIPFVPTSSAFALPVDTADADIAARLAAGESPFDDVIAIGDLEAFPDNLDHNTIVLPNVLLEELHSLRACREGIDRFGCVDENPDGGDLDPMDCAEYEYREGDVCVPYDDWSYPPEDGIRCSCTAGPETAGLWLLLLALLAVTPRRASRAVALVPYERRRP